MIDKKTQQLIDYYLTTRYVYGIEEALKKLVDLTTKENYLQITKYIADKNVKKSELNLSMFIVEIACKDYQELIPIINNNLKIFKDKDAIEDLEEALQKINS